MAFYNNRRKSVVIQLCVERELCVGEKLPHEQIQNIQLREKYTAVANYAFPKGKDFWQTYTYKWTCLASDKLINLTINEISKSALIKKCFEAYTYICF